MNTLTVITIGEPLVARLSHVARKVTAVLDSLSPAVDLLLRLWVANVFFKAGLTKIQSWDSTVLLFTYEYSVPLLSPEIAPPWALSRNFSFPRCWRSASAGASPPSCSSSSTSSR